MEVEPYSEALVEYDYEAQHSDELTIRVGDVVTELTPTEPGWMRGKLRGKLGVFPDNFVKMVHRDSSKPRPKPAEPATGSLKINGVAKRPGRRRCRALFSYTPEKPDELGLRLHDVIEVLEEMEPGWWKGSLNGKVGVFPSNFVEELPALPDAEPLKEIKPKPVKGVGLGDILRDAKARPPPLQSPKPPDPAGADSPAPQLPPKPVKELCRALFAYQRQNDDELTLKEGDIVTIVSKESEDKGWWRGELAGKVGVFPDNFVEVITAAEKPARPDKPPTKPPAKPEAPEATGRAAATEPDAAKPKTAPSQRAASGRPASEDAGEQERVPAVSNTSPSSSAGQPSEAPAPPPASTKPDPKASTAPPALPKTPPPKPVSPKPTCKESTPPPLTQKPSAAKPTTPPPPAPKPSALPPTNMSHSNATNSPVQTEVAPASGAPAGAAAGAKTAGKPDGDTSLEEFDAVERGPDRLTHITADRARAPGRRPPSTLFSRESMSPQSPLSPSTPMETPVAEEPAMVNGSAEREGAPASSPSAPAAPPWMKELQRAQNKRISRLVETDDDKMERQSTEPAAGHAASTPPLWMRELQRSKRHPAAKAKDEEKASGDPGPAASDVDAPGAAPPARPARPEPPSDAKPRKPTSRVPSVKATESSAAAAPARPPAPTVAAPVAAAPAPSPAAVAAAAASPALAPAPAAAADLRALQEQCDRLQKQLNDQARQFSESLTALRADYTKRMRTVLDELDAEKKARLVMQVQLDRLDQLIKDANFNV